MLISSDTLILWFLFLEPFELISGQIQSPPAQTNGTAPRGIRLDKARRPYHEPGIPLHVAMTGVILDIEDMDTFKMEFKVNLVLRQSWRDTRTIQLLGVPSSEAHLNSSSMQNVWTPDLFFTNGRELVVHNVGYKQGPGGSISKTERMTVKAKCHMSFRLYPFDHQKCSLDIQSYYWTNEDVEYNFGRMDDLGRGRKGVELSSGATAAPPFHITGAQARISTNHFHSGNYSQVIVTVSLRRLWSSYFGIYYMSLAASVSLSLLSLWLVYPKISAIVNFFNIAFIIIFLVLYKNSMDVPKTYYVTPMEVYGTLSVTFVVLVLLVNVYVLYYVKADEEEEECRRRRQEIIEMNERQGHGTRKIPRASVTIVPICQPSTEALDTGSEHGSTSEQNNWEIIKTNFMDKVRRNSHWTLLFGFLIFNLIYWVVLLSIHYAF